MSSRNSGFMVIHNVETAIDLRKVFSSAYEKDPVEMSAEIEEDLSDLVYKEILSEIPTNVYVSERKGVNLFHPFFNSILEKHQLTSISLYKQSPVVRMKEAKSTNKDTSILLTDTIGEAKEVETISKILSDSGIPLSKVCGYLAKKEGIEKLQNQFPLIQFKFVNEAENDEAYKDSLWKLTLVYHSRIESPDSNHPMFEITAEVEEDLSNLVYNELLSESPTNVYAIDKKAIILFHPFLNSIIEKHHLSTINLYKNSPSIRIREVTSINKNKSILLTDAIGQGQEVETIAKMLKKSHIPLSKVCGYLAKKESLKKLQKRFPKIKFKFIHQAENDETYKDALWRLMPVYHSRIEPLDSDHPFNLHLFTCKIEKNTMKNIIYSACAELFGGDLFAHEDDLRSNYIMGYTVECADPESLKEELIFKEQKEYIQIERLQLRTRFDMVKSQLRIMAFCAVNVNVNHFYNDEVQCDKFLPKEYCHTFKGHKSMDIENYAIICPHCLDTNISIQVLDKIADIIKDRVKLVNKDCQVRHIRKYSPFEDI